MKWRLILGLMYAPVLSAQQPASPPFAAPDCKLTFAVVSGWEVVRDSLGGRESCRFLVRPRDWKQRLIASDSVDVHTITLQVFTRGFQALLRETPFQRSGRRWLVLGRQNEEAPADTIRGYGWTGLKGIASVGCFKIKGTYSGLCDQPTAFIGTTARSALLIGGPKTEEAFARILATLRFQ